MVFTADGRTLYFRSGRGIYSAPVGGGGGGAAAPPAAATGGRGGRGGTTPAAATTSSTGGGATARQVTFSINMELDLKAQRRQVFEEGWRVMKNRFYDAKMHGADWEAAKAHYGSASRPPGRRRGTEHGDQPDDRRS
jgi:tricorn protease